MVAVNTGARAITLANVHLFRYNRTKGSANWRHEVTIEGLEEEESGDDPVY